MQNFRTVQRVSAALSLCASAALVCLPLAVLWSVIRTVQDPSGLKAAFPGVTLPEVFPAGIVASAMALGSLPMVVALYVLWQMRCLFRLFHAGDSLTPDAAQTIHRIGLGVLAVMAVAALSRTAQILLLTASNPPGARSLSISFGSSDLASVLLGGLLVLIGWAMQNAVAAAEENRQIV